jgi:hypothetical protein
MSTARARCSISAARTDMLRAIFFYFESTKEPTRYGIETGPMNTAGFGSKNPHVIDGGSGVGYGHRYSNSNSSCCQRRSYFTCNWNARCAVSCVGWPWSNSRSYTFCFVFLVDGDGAAGARGAAAHYARPMDREHGRQRVPRPQELQKYVLVFDLVIPYFLTVIYFNKECCIYHKPRRFDESSDESGTDDDGDNDEHSHGPGCSHHGAGAAAAQ